MRMQRFQPLRPSLGFLPLFVFMLQLSGPASAHGPVHAQIRGLSERIEADPRNAALYVERARLYLDEAHPRRAIADLRRAIRIEPATPDAHFHLGEALLRVQRPASAEASARKFLASLSHDARGGQVRGRVLLGQALSAQGRLAQAADAYAEALSLSETPRPEHVLALSELLSRMGRVDDALDALDTGLSKLGVSVALQQRAFELEKQRGRREAALERLERLVSSSPQPAAWLCEKAKLLLSLADPAGARVAAQSGLDLLAALPPSRRSAKALRRLEEDLREVGARAGATQQTLVTRASQRDGAPLKSPR